METRVKVSPYHFSLTKRVFDLILTLFLLIVLSPLLLLIGLAALLSAGSPIIFKQKRTGQNGKPFTMLKFRTMKRNAALLKSQYLHLNEAPEPMFKIQNDPRFVGIGKFLAKTGLDELPQLWNILRGEMSFVGPRPLPPQEAENLPTEWRRWREMVRPGIFSAWAIASDKHYSLERWRQLEAETMTNGSIPRDLTYVLRTPLSLLVLFLRKSKAPVKSA